MRIINRPCSHRSSTGTASSPPRSRIDQLDLHDPFTDLHQASSSPRISSRPARPAARTRSESPPTSESGRSVSARPRRRQIDGKARHSPTNDWDTDAVWVDAGRAVTATQERHTEPQDNGTRRGARFRSRGPNGTRRRCAVLRDSPRFAEICRDLPRFTEILPRFAEIRRDQRFPDKYRETARRGVLRRE